MHIGQKRKKQKYNKYNKLDDALHDRKEKHENNDHSITM